MQEVQFVSELVINLIEGLVDFNASKINRYYKEYDLDFPQANDVSERVEGFFDKLAAIPATAFSDTVFQQYQLAFSLMVVVDRLRSRRAVNSARIEQVMHDIDARVAAYRDLDVKTDDQTTFLDGFSGGNLHRINKRLIRDKALADTLA
jgi:ABC-type uncharacterized transport system ATPase subunit